MNWYFELIVGIVLASFVFPLLRGKAPATNPVAYCIVSYIGAMGFAFLSWVFLKDGITNYLNVGKPTPSWALFYFLTALGISMLLTLRIKR